MRVLSKAQVFGWMTWTADNHSFLSVVDVCMNSLIVLWKEVLKGEEHFEQV